mmetsp:Transcript_47705/g.152915  ORF Transcript_47705/g.152915 Transcript_47705/m.152915 type:complete len:226 (-) Transcript_47705:1874-2551(-)
MRTCSSSFSRFCLMRMELSSAPATVCTRRRQPAHVWCCRRRCARRRRSPPSCMIHHTSMLPERRSDCEGKKSRPRARTILFCAALHSARVSTRMSASSSCPGWSHFSGNPSTRQLGSSPPSPHPCRTKVLPMRNVGATMACVNPETSARSRAAASDCLSFAASCASRTREPSTMLATTHSPCPFFKNAASCRMASCDSLRALELFFPPVFLGLCSTSSCGRQLTA